MSCWYGIALQVRLLRFFKPKPRFFPKTGGNRKKPDVQLFKSGQQARFTVAA